jgi:glycosyltransferase involved in cell wall biosynthesis
MFGTTLQIANTIQLPPVAIAVSNYNGADTILGTITSIKQLRYPSFSITLCDDASSDNSVTLVQEQHSDVKILQNHCSRGAILFATLIN